MPRAKWLLKSDDPPHRYRSGSVPARMASRHHPSLARHQLLSRSLFDVDRGGFTGCFLRRANADGPHGATSAPHDVRTSFDLAGLAGDGDVSTLSPESAR